MDIGPTELIIILLIVVLLFGVGRISKVAGELGSGIREFKKGLKDEDDEAVSTAPAAGVQPAPPAAPEGGAQVVTLPVRSENNAKQM